VGPPQNPCKPQYLQGFLIKKLSKKLSKTPCSTFFITLFCENFAAILMFFCKLNFNYFCE